ncbi:Hypothetical protein PHPALM_4341 [Phytophthora palmivora]|uniref:Ankyrin repeat protein n=1 Tax=Phytophthora palmivora TaxID=4796 RepID=A0A2P4YK35_9STRA|nr:Hypothetical protein PHPALM_4341 [Phytophthora palmivora]
MNGAAVYRQLDVVLYLLEHRSEGFSSDAMTNPGDIEVQCLFSDSDTVLSKKILNPVSTAQRKMVQSVFKIRPSFVQGCLRCLAEIAVRTNNVEMLDWVNQFGLELRSTAPIRYAVRYNYMSLLKWFHRNGFMMNEPDLLELAVRHKSLGAARWLWTRGYEITSLKFAEIAGDTMFVPLLRWVLDYGPPLNIPLALKFAMNYNYMEVMLWLSECDRLPIVLWALKTSDKPRQKEKEDVQKLLLWILTMTSFNDESTRHILGV